MTTTTTTTKTNNPTQQKKDKKKNPKKKNVTKNPPPMEITQSEYQELLSEASNLDPTEVCAELHECVRYGDLDAARAILETFMGKQQQQQSDYKNENNSDDSIVNMTDANGNTPLHKAAANGSLELIHLLLYYNAKHLPNTSGKNTPLHWAAANGHYTSVEMILNHYDSKDIDVLLKNDFGRSILTEGFGSKCTEVVNLLLEHDSASEERLLGGGKEIPEDEIMGDGSSDIHMSESAQNNLKPSADVDVDIDQMIGVDSHQKATDIDCSNSVNTSSTSSNGITHEFDFLRDGNVNDNDVDDTIINYDETMNDASTPSLLVRELPITNADNPFGDKSDDDTTGLGIWCASLVMARWMASKSILGRFDHNVKLLELGAGCGVPGLTAALYSNAETIYMTDLNPITVRNLQYNVDLNSNRSCTSSNSVRGEWHERVKVLKMDWGDESTWPTEKIDVIIGSDLIYQKSIVPLLKKVVNGLVNDDGYFLYVCPTDGRDGLKEFITSMKQDGFKCVSEEIAPDLYRSNPLKSGDADDAFLHFYELPVTEYKLYEFRRNVKKSS